MKMMLACVGAAVVLGAAGCVTTVDSRIRANPGIFASFPPDVQEKVRQERVEIGFTEDMVRVALGTPTRVMMRQTQASTTTVWVYTTHDPETYTDMVPVTYYGRSGRGYLRAYPDIAWVDRTYWREREAARIEFRDGKVTGIETTGRR